MDLGLVCHVNCCRESFFAACTVDVTVCFIRQTVSLSPLASYEARGERLTVRWNYRHCVCTTPQTEDYTAWAVAMVRTMLSAATTAQFLCLAAAPRDRASNTRDWPFGADHTISRRTPDPSSRPSDPFLHLEGPQTRDSFLILQHSFMHSMFFDTSTLFHAFYCSAPAA